MSWTVHSWNWGWYKTEFKSRAEAERCLLDEARTARLNFHLPPYMTNPNGKRVFADFEIKELIQDLVDYIDYHNKNLTKKQLEKIDALREVVEG